MTDRTPEWPSEAHFPAFGSARRRIPKVAGSASVMLLGLVAEPPPSYSRERARWARRKERHRVERAEQTRRSEAERSIEPVPVPAVYGIGRRAIQVARA